MTARCKWLKKKIMQARERLKQVSVLEGQCGEVMLAAPWVGRQVVREQTVCAETDVGAKQYLMLRCSWACKIKRIISINRDCWVGIRAGQGQNVGEPKLISDLDLAVWFLGSPGCLSSNLWSAAGRCTTPHSGEDKCCVLLGMASEMRQIRGKAGLRV